MDYKAILQQLQDGSRSQRKRKEQLDKEKKLYLATYQKKKDPATEEKLHETVDAQLRYCAKIKEGNKNSLRTLKIRLFFLYFLDKENYRTVKEVETIMKPFENWLNMYEAIIQKKDWKEEEQCNTMLLQILDTYEKKKKELEKGLEKKKIKTASNCMLGISILTATLFLFKETNEIKYDEKIFNEKNRWNPLNPFFPFRFS